MPVRLRVRICGSNAPEAAAAAIGEPGATVRVVGGSDSLGNWDPKRSPQLARVDVEGGASIWEGTLDDEVATPGIEFKYCVLVMSKHQYHWETAQGHRMPSKDSSDELHHFNGASASSAPAHDHHHQHHTPKKDEWASLATEVEHELDAVDAVDCWIPWRHGSNGGSSGSRAAPRSIFHAFHWPFVEVRKHLKDLRDRGFDAVQISPAQKSTTGQEWWTRYQPKDYTRIEGLGSVDDLRLLCQEATDLGVMIIADVVFNHMIVVASAHDWERAQKRPKDLERLKEKLTKAVAPMFSAEDFQWPWFKMDGAHWDNENRYEGWGCGEWSELKHCKKVVDIHNRHLQDLIDAGVRGIRFDAVKHMRAEHVGEYISYLRQQPFPVYAYGEVLSVDEKMQKEYMEPLDMPTTDFALTVYLNDVVKRTASAKTVLEGSRVAALRSAAQEGLDLIGAAEGALGATTKGVASEMSAPMPPALSSDSVRFARNHDTVQNPGSFYGLSGDPLGARVVWAWLLAVHDGTVLMYPEDILDHACGGLLTRALKFRKQASARADSTEVCIRCADVPPKGGASVKRELAEARAGGRPALASIVLRNAEGGVEGLCLLNLFRDAKLTVGAIPLRGGSGDEASLLAEDGSVVSLLPDGKLTSEDGSSRTVSIPPWDALFFVEAPF